MSKYTLSDLQSAALVASGGKGHVDIAVAVSLAENPSMESTRNSPPNHDGSIDRGPWQINSKAHAEVSDQCAHDLACSATAAFKISNGFTDFGPWTTFKNGAYEKNLDRAKQSGGDNTPGAGVLGLGIGPDISLPNPLKGIDLLATSVEKFVEGLFNSSTWFRVGKVVVGLFLGASGLIILIRKAGVPTPIPV